MQMGDNSCGDFVCLGKELVCFPKSNEESLKYEQRSDIILFTFSQDHSGFSLRIDCRSNGWR